MRRAWRRTLGGLAGALFLVAGGVEAADPWDGLDRVPGELVVDFDDSLPNAACLDRLAQLGLVDATIGGSSADDANLVVVRLPKPGDEPSAAARLATLAGVQAASPNFLFRAAYLPNDPRFAEQWHMRQIRADSAWEVSRGRGVVVAVIDTGVTFEVDPTNKAITLLEDLEATAHVPGYDFVNDRTLAADDHAHGNHVAGTVAQSTNNGKGVAGVAYEATIMPVKVLSKHGSGTLAQVSAGIRFAADHGADVINMSLGGGPATEVMREACNYAKERGVILVCAAGNNGAPTVSYPAAYEACVAVAALNSIKERSFYSNWGDEIAIAAPGGDRDDHNGDGIPDGVLQNTIEPGRPEKVGYYSFIGTSMASPHAAGVAALIKAMGVTDPDAVLEVMQASAERLEQPADENFYGAGMVDARAAVERIGLWFSLEKLLLALAGFLLLARLAPVKPGLDWCPFHVLGVLVGSVGFFFLPFLGVYGFPLQDLVCKGLPEWDLWLFGAQGHANALFYSALLPFVLLVLCFRSPRPVRALVAGLCLGIAAHLFWYGLRPVANLMWIPDLVMRLGDRAFFAVNGGLSLLAALLMRLGEER